VRVAGRGNYDLVDLVPEASGVEAVLPSSVADADLPPSGVVEAVELMDDRPRP
jgi:hypothetical protein